MASFEHYFASAALHLAVPDTSLPFPPTGPPDDWLSRLRDARSERKLAFFDEQMSYFLTVQIDHPAALPPADPANPPISLLKLLAHIQISTEAMFISPKQPERDGALHLSAPPRTAASRLNPRTAHHPSIFPPSTPNPTPLTDQSDRQYLNADGILLFAGIWGQDASSEAFSLLWSTTSKTWVAVYKLALNVSYTRVTFSHPLLCLTIAATLREKPLALTQQKSPLGAYLLTFPEVASNPSTPTTADGLAAAQAQSPDAEAFQQVNLLQGLAAGPTFAATSTYLPSSRLGPESRQKLFGLPPLVQPQFETPTPSPMTAARMAPPTLRKSFRKTLNVISGIQMRMRTTFVPAVMLPEGDHGDERDLREAGNEERTVVLCIEVENPVPTDGMDFVVDSVDIQVGDQGATTTLIGWGESLVDPKIFPLVISPQGQYNLLYAVTFLQSPEEHDALSAISGQRPDPSDLRRTVNINITGRPCPKTSSNTVFPTIPFVSKWNTVLNLSPRRPAVQDDQYSDHEVLPEPASPFPVTPLSSIAPSRSRASFIPPSPNHSLMSSISQKRHTLPNPNPNARSPGGSPSPSPSPFRPSSLVPLAPRLSVPTPGSSLRTQYQPLPPSLQIPRSPTTFDAPSFPFNHNPNTTAQKDALPLPDPPMTPAYPAYPSAWPSSPGGAQTHPESSQSQTYVGPSVEMRRERAMVPGGVPPTPGPGAGMGMGVSYAGYETEEPQVDEPIVISVGLLQDQGDGKNGKGNGTGENGKGKGGEGEGEGGEWDGKLAVRDTFALDIFVYNRSGRTRRFEVSCPDRRRGTATTRKTLLPLDNRVRIGPLLPSACQSVRMRFMALIAGVHTVDALTLTDVESGNSTTLRSVMDIVVHE